MWMLILGNKGEKKVKWISKQVICEWKEQKEASPRNLIGSQEKEKIFLTLFCTFTIWLDMNRL